MLYDDASQDGKPDSDVSRCTTKVSESERLAMAVASGLGATSTDIARHFGYDPRTVRKAIREVPEEERRLIGQMVALEVSGLHVAVARRALSALLERDLNRLRQQPDGSVIPGSYVVGESQLAKLAGLTTTAIGELRAAAGLGTEREAASNPVAQLLRNEQDLNRLVQSLPAGTKLKLDVSQSVSVESPEAPSAVPASFELFE